MREGTERACPKPLELMTRILLKCKTAAVLDPFLGSGTTVVAAKALGVRAIGIELEERYCEIAARRLSQAVLPVFADALDVQCCLAEESA